MPRSVRKRLRGIRPAWDVEYEFHCIPACAGPKGIVEATSETVAVDGTVKDLLPGTAYKVYVTAANVGGVSRSPQPSEEGLPFETDAIPPTITEEAVTDVSQAEAKIEAIVDPGGTRASFLVQYVTVSQFEASGFDEALETPEGSADGSQGVAVSVAMTGLSPSSAYVARFVVSNSVDGTREVAFGEPVTFVTRSAVFPLGGCANEVFRSEESALLPDCRAYEQASPVNKGGGGVEAIPGMVQAPGMAGNAITFFSQAGIPGGVGAQDYPTFVATRGNGSWGTQGLLPAQSWAKEPPTSGSPPVASMWLPKRVSQAMGRASSAVICRPGKSPPWCRITRDVGRKNSVFLLPVPARTVRRSFLKPGWR